ncbi:MAG: NAD-dependent epimerase/dehydratase family protein [Deltaproteobacteria bacterium]|nr:NAD-dependent epimerase/dehydratase family protein [Deltaproteobacteria bacterium]
MNGSPSIIIAGASGYIGKAIIPKILEKFPGAHITALSRSAQKSDDPRITWKACDLFSLKSIEEASPASVDLAIYLVHSMGPTASLDQGSFADYDLLLADNFARVLRTTNLKQVIYLGGLIPETSHMSLHLQSRLEMENVFNQYKLPSTIFRAGLILGAGGSSFQILLKLVKRLPVMVCPRWTQTLTTPVDLETVLTSLTSAALNERHIGQTYDLAGCKPLTYVEMMKETARRMSLTRYFIPVPFFTPTLSRLWVRLITGTPKDLVYPLIESLEHTMVARPKNLFSDESKSRTYFELLQSAFFETRASQAFFHFRAQRKTVRSVQRLFLPEGRDARWVKDQYLTWLPGFLSPLIGVKTEGETHSIYLRFFIIKLLVLKISLERSSPDRQVLYISDGLMVSGGKRGRLEFRVVLNRQFVLAAIHDYKPSLPWLIYKYTQALVHLFVMRAFGKFLGSQNFAKGGEN